jgi:hypothetical protein
VPIKASSIYSEPTLDKLEARFKENETNRQPDRQKLKNAIDWALRKSPASLQELMKELKKEKIHTVLRQNEKGLAYGITFIDYRNKSVFNGSDIGKSYSIAGLNQKLAALTRADHHQAALLEKLLPQKDRELPHKQSQEPSGQEVEKSKETSHAVSKDSLLELLLKNEKGWNRLPYELLKKKKKKRGPHL